MTRRLSALRKHIMIKICLSSWQNLLNYPVQEMVLLNIAVCFQVTDKGTCTNKKNLVFFLSTKCLTLLLIKKVSDSKVNHLSSSTFQSSVQKEPWMLKTFEKKKKKINMLFAFARCSRKNLSVMTVVVQQYINAPSAIPPPSPHPQLIYTRST